MASMTSFNINDNIFIKEEQDIASHPKVIQLFNGVNSNNTIKPESNILQSTPLMVYDVIIKEEEIDEVTEFIQVTVLDENKKLQVDSQYKDPSIICDGVQVKQETNGMDNVKPTTAVCNNVLNHVKLEQTDSVEAAGEHFIGECDYCNKMFDCRLKLVKHIHNHIIQESCKTCYVLLHRATLNSNHVKGKLNIKHQHVCCVCNKSFSRISHLKQHELTHTKEFPYVCNVCNKRFKDYSNHRRHEFTHTKKRPYVCYVCQKCFTASYNLKIHVRLHTNECPYVCNVCNKCFKRKDYLKAHELTHTNECPFLCNVCNKSFARKQSLKKHELTHKKERPHKCNVCSKGFTQRWDLRYHELTTHTNIHSYACNVCDKTFKTIKNLKCHQRRNHIQSNIDSNKVL